MTRVVPAGAWAESNAKILPGLTRTDRYGATMPREWSRWQVGVVMVEIRNVRMVEWHLPEFPGASAERFRQYPDIAWIREVPDDHPFPEEWAPGRQVQHRTLGWAGAVIAVDWDRPRGPITVQWEAGHQAPRGWSPFQLRLLAPAATVEPNQRRDADLRIYQLLTGNTGLYEHLNDKPLKESLWRLSVDLDSDGEVGDSRAAILTPDGEQISMLELSRVGSRIRDEIRRQIQAHLTAGSKHVYRCTTGVKWAADALNNYPHPDWIILAQHLPGGADKHVQLLDGDRVMGNVPTEPSDGFSARVVEFVERYRQGQAPATSVETPAPDGRPKWVACRACGIVHRACWEEGDTTPIARQCDSCYDEYFAPCSQPEDASAAPAVTNPCLEAPPEKKLVAPPADPPAAPGGQAPRPPMIQVRLKLRGTVEATLWLSGVADAGKPDEHKAFRDGPTQRPDLHVLLGQWVRQYPDAVVDADVEIHQHVIEAARETGRQAAAGIQPAKPAPAGAADAVRAARQLGQTPVAETTTAEASGPAGGEQPVNIPLALIDDLPGGNYRRTFDPERMEELTALVKAHGVVQPVVVRREGERYQLVFGYRRREASRRAGLTEIPAVIRDCSVESARLMMLVENKGREDLNPLDTARAFEDLRKRNPTWSQDDLATQVGVKRSTVSEYLRLLNLPTVLHPLVADGRMAVKTAGLFLGETAALPTVVVDKVAAQLVADPPSYREASAAIRVAIQRISGTVARATGPTTNRTGATNPAERGQNQPPVTTNQANPATQQASQMTPAPAPPPAPVQTAGPGPVLAPVVTTPSAPHLDPEVVRAHSLAEIGRRLWGKDRAWVAPDDQALLDRECYLPLDQVIGHWEQRQEVGAVSIPRTIGGARVDIPEQRVWFRSYDESSTYGGCAFTIEGMQLQIQAGQHGAVEFAYVGSPVYYRTQLVAASSGGSKHLYQQLVIQDGARHIVVAGSGTVMCRRELVPKWADLVNQLPGLPGEAKSNGGGD